MRGLGFPAWRNCGWRRFLSVGPGHQSSCRLNCVCGENPWSMFALCGSTWTTWRRGRDAQALPLQSYLLVLLLLLLLPMPLLLLEHRFLARVQRRLAHIIPPITTKTNWCLHSHLKKTRIRKAHVLKMKKKCSPKQTKFLSIGYVMNRARNSNSREKIQ